MDRHIVFDRSDLTVNLLYRHDQYRIVIKPQDHSTPIFISRFYYVDAEKIKNSDNCLHISNQVYSLQHSISITESIFDNVNRRLDLLHGDGIRSFYFSPQEWSDLKNFFA